ncbi:MAG: 6,7-dimethyl-8-ribityllumazine synthase [Zoogloeaceae bacterium]|jgi:6,7-dimethyl-8-ribityllumazine synthase|nr:6,7-dimethyl-8-ribityllumazine synthase [Zoogloeaceae bacterium]
MQRIDPSPKNQPELCGKGRRIGVIVSRFNDTMGETSLAAALKELARLGVADTDIQIVRVPGALEIPLAAQALAQQRNTRSPDALIALGAVIRGETYHFEVVSNDACRGLMDTQLQTGVPIANGILTCENEEQALVRAETKGRDCARVAIEMAALLETLRT